MRPEGGSRAGDSRQDLPRTQPQAREDFLRRLNWAVLRPLARHLGGEARSLYRGPGLELAELREYAPGDDVRRIDWNASARAARPFVRERALDAWLIVDVSASLDWGTAHCLKRERALEFVAVAGQLLGRQGNKLAALLFADRPLGLVTPGRGRVQLLRLLAAVEAEQSRAREGTTDLAAALVAADGIIRRRSLVLVVSDFLVAEGWQSPMRRLAGRHEAVAVRLVDPRESDLPDVGIVTLEDPETGDQLTVDTSDRGLRERFRAAGRGQAERIGADLARCRVDLLSLSTGDSLLPALVDFLSTRDRRRAAGAAPRRPGPNGRGVPTVVASTA
jgi:uncharacterized protein (DUF58 family)